jgi:hypothetical protein
LGFLYISLETASDRRALTVPEKSKIFARAIVELLEYEDTREILPWQAGDLTPVHLVLLATACMAGVSNASS